MDQRFQEEFYEVPTLGELELVEVDHRRYLVLEQPAREQRGVAGIGRQLAAGADQQHVDRFAQTRELALVIQHDRLDPAAFGDEPEQPRFAATRIRLNKKSGVDQCGKIEFQLSAADDLPDVHRRFRSRLAVYLTRTSPGINVSPNLSPSVLCQKRPQCFPQPPPAARNCLHIPRVGGKSLGHQNSHRLIALPLQPLINASGDYAIGKFPCDRLYPDSFRSGQRLAIAAAAFALSSLSIEVDAPMLELGASRSHAHGPMPLDPKAQHRRLPAYILYASQLPGMHSLRFGAHKLMPAAG